MPSYDNKLAPAIGISISESPDQEAHGLSSGHLRDAMAKIALGLLALGKSLAYGGDLREDGFTELLAELVWRYRGHPRHSGTIAVTSYLAWPVHVRMALDEVKAFEREHGPVIRVVMLSEDGVPLTREQRCRIRQREPREEEWAKGLTTMRTVVRGDIQARVVLGGRVTGFKGAMPGIAEEASLSLEIGQPLFVLGGFGGCARDIAESVGLVNLWAGSRGEWPGRCRFAKYSSDNLNNGLSPEENGILARTPYIQQAVSLVSRGLRRTSSS